MQSGTLTTVLIALALVTPIALGTTGTNSTEPTGNGTEDHITVEDPPDTQISEGNITPPAAAPPGTGQLDPWVDANGDAMFGDLDMDRNDVIFNGRALRGTVSGNLLWDGQTVCLQTTGCSGTGLQGQLPIEVDRGVVALSTTGCAVGQVWKFDGSGWNCEDDVDTDTDTTYDGADFALSNQVCANGEVVAGVDASGNIACVVDQDTDTDTTYDGADFALSNQACASGEVVAGVTADGLVACVVDQDTTSETTSLPWGNVTDKPSGFADGVDDVGITSETDPTVNTLAKASLSCASGQLAKFDGSAWACAEDVDTDTDTTYDGADFALSDQACASGEVVAGVDASGNIACVLDQDTDTDSDTLASLSCTDAQVAKWDAPNGVWICAQDIDTDTDTTYDGTDFAVSDQACASGEVVAGVDTSGNIACVADQDTEYEFGNYFSIDGNNLVELASCLDDELLRYDAGFGGWDCSPDVVDGGDAETLDNVDSSSFLRSDTSDTFQGDQLLVAGADGLRVLNRAEINGDLYLGGTDASDSDSILFDTGTAERFSWIDVWDAFSLSNSIGIDGTIGTGTVGPPDTYNRLGAASPASGDMGTAGDLAIADDLEVDRRAYLSGQLFMEGATTSGFDGTQTIFFYEDDSRVGESIRWDDAEDEFLLTDSVRADGNLMADRHVIAKDYVWINHGGPDADSWLCFHEGGADCGSYLKWDNFEGAFWLSDGLDLGGSGEIGARGNHLYLLPDAGQDFTDVIFGSGSSTTPDIDVQIGAGGLCVDNDGSCGPPGDGSIEADNYITGASDVAEVYPSKETLQAGEVVTLDQENPGHFERTTTAGQSGPLRVVSTEPGMLLGGPGGSELLEAGLDPEDVTGIQTLPGTYPIALSGRVPVKATIENGPIQVGDPLTSSSIPGMAMKASGNNPVLGYAMEPLAGGTGAIEMFVTPGSQQPLDASTDESLRQELQQENQELRDRLTQLEAIVADLAEEHEEEDQAS